MNNLLSPAWDYAVRGMMDSYDKIAWRSVTELCDSPRCKLLGQRHKGERPFLLRDGWSLMQGQAVHSYIESFSGSIAGAIPEMRFITRFGDVQIQWKPDIMIRAGDCYDIHDYKTSTAKRVEMILENGPPSHYKLQLCLYRYLAEQYHGFKIGKLILNFAVMGWSQTEALRVRGYPQEPVMPVVITEPWSNEYCEKYLSERIELWQKAEKLPDDQLPDTPEDDCWVKESKWKVYKRQKNGDLSLRALKNFDTMVDAESFAAQKPEERKAIRVPGERTRCKRFCSVNMICSQYQKYLAENQETEVAVVEEDA